MKLSKEDLKPVSHQVRAQVWDQLSIQVMAQVRSQVSIQIRNKINETNR
jgi:hypothetical protein